MTTLNTFYKSKGFNFIDPVVIESAKQYKALMKEIGITYLMGIDTNPKTVKGQKLGYYTGIIYMQPSFVTCPYSKKAKCYDACLNTAGRGAMNSVQVSRKKKLDLYLNNPALFYGLLIWELKVAFNKYGDQLKIRLRGTDDILHHMNYLYTGIDQASGRKSYDTIFNMFPNIQFYDYGKNPLHIGASLSHKNYHLTLSYSEANKNYAKEVLQNAKDYNLNFAAVFRSREDIPKFFKGFPVINGDDHDLRFIDPDDQAYCVALVAKGKAKKDTSGFVIS